MSKLKIPIDQFLNLNNGDSIRRTEILAKVEFLREQFCESDEDWLKACLNSIPKNIAESLFIVFLIGGALTQEFMSFKIEIPFMHESQNLVN